jgi:orotate phosphoribosyltransferase
MKAKMHPAARRALAVHIRRSGAVHSGGQHTLSAGAVSDTFVDGKLAVVHPDFLRVVARLMDEVMAREATEARAVGGLVLGACPFVMAVSLHAQLPWSLVRKSDQVGPGDQQIEGWQPLEGAPVVMIEDVATTGASLLRAIRVVQQAGAQVPLAISLVDRGAGAGDLLAEDGVQYLTLVGHDDLGIAPIRVA